MLKVDPLEDPGDTARNALRVGVEEEFLLYDVRTGELAARAPALIEMLEHSGSSARSELQSTQVEVATEPSRSLKSITSGLLQNRKRLTAAAHELGLAVVPAGLPPGASPLHTPVDDPRYRKMFERYGAAAQHYQGCGTHVHVEVPDRDVAVAVLGHIRPWLPLLVAIGGNSPYCHETDTHFSSWRIAMQRRYPLAGLPPLLRSAAEYDATVAALVEVGALEDQHTCFWLARLSDKYPTIEIRASDVGLTADDSALQAALSRAIVLSALRDADSGMAPPVIDQQWADAAVWAAARFGLNGPLIDPVRREQLPATAMLAILLEKTTDALCEAGDYYNARTLLSGVKRRGTGSQLQRTAGSSGPKAVLGLLTMASCTAEGLRDGSTALTRAVDNDWNGVKMENKGDQPTNRTPEPTPPAEDQTHLVHEEHEPDTGPQPKAAGGAVVVIAAVIAIAFLVVAVYLGGSLFGAW